jgi:hypothetical protein
MLLLNNKTNFRTHLLSKLLDLEITYLLNQWSRIPFEKLTVSEIVKKITTYYETRRFITASTSVRNLFLS